MRSDVRFAVSSVRIPPLLHELRSAGISVDLIHPPFAYRKKSSPGLTLGSIAVRSRPCSGGDASFALAAGAGCEGAEAQAKAKATTTTTRSLCMAWHPATARG